MIRLTRLNRVPMVLNSDLIEHIDVTPDTVITLTTGQILRVRESAEEVIRRIVDYRRQIYGPEGPPSGGEDEIETEDGDASAVRLELVERAGHPETDASEPGDSPSDRLAGAGPRD